MYDSIHIDLNNGYTVRLAHCAPEPSDALLSVADLVSKVLTPLLPSWCKLSYPVCPSVFRWLHFHVSELVDELFIMLQASKRGVHLRPVVEVEDDDRLQYVDIVAPAV